MGSRHLASIHPSAKMAGCNMVAFHCISSLKYDMLKQRGPRYLVGPLITNQPFITNQPLITNRYVEPGALEDLRNPLARIYPRAALRVRPHSQWMLRPTAPDYLRVSRPFEPLVHPSEALPIMADALVTLKRNDRKTSSSPSPHNYGSITNTNGNNQHKNDHRVEVLRDADAGNKGSRRDRRSQVAHALLRNQSATELQHMAPATSAKVQTAIRASLVFNVVCKISSPTFRH
jgi:hypothetical protein